MCETDTSGVDGNRFPILFAVLNTEDRRGIYLKVNLVGYKLAVKFLLCTRIANSEKIIECTTESPFPMGGKSSFTPPLLFPPRSKRKMSKKSTFRTRLVTYYPPVDRARSPLSENAYRTPPKTSQKPKKPKNTFFSLFVFSTFFVFFLGRVAFQ